MTAGGPGRGKDSEKESLSGVCSASVTAEYLIIDWVYFDPERAP